MTQLAVPGPLDESDLNHDLRLDPVSADFRDSGSFGEGGFRDLERVPPGPQLLQESGIEAGSDLPREDEIVLVEVAEEQRAQSGTRALRIGKAADHELLRRLAFHLQPVG